MTSPLLLGTATASYQIEGAGGGRADCIWDTFAARPGAIVDGSDGSLACDSYHRLDEDLTLLAELGVDVYRFSLSWPRVQPGGRGPADPAGLDYYSRLVDGLLERGIIPMPTLYHWDLPQPLGEAGGWTARDTASRFADYAALAQKALGDRVTRWATLNEPWCSAFLGYGSGVHAPGVQDGTAALAASHHLLLAHALGAQALRAGGAPEVGVVLNLYPVRPESPEHDAAARVVEEIQNELWLGALLDGRYPAAVPPHDEHAADLELIRGSLDWLGVNYYTPLRVGAPVEAEGGSWRDQAAYPGAGAFGLHPRGERTSMNWEVEADGLAEVLLAVSRRAPALPLWVTENGAAYPDTVRAVDGSVDDPDRTEYLRTHLDAVHRARADGADVRGYLIWTLLDNYEWAWGYTQKFGIVEVDRATMERRPKASYRWLAQYLRERA